MSSNNPGPTAESLLGDLERLRGVVCADCGTALSPQQMLLAIAIGFKDAPRCLPCLGIVLGADPARLRDSLLSYIHQRECYTVAWNWANRDPGSPEEIISKTLPFPTAENPPTPSQETRDSQSSIETVNDSWDAGDLGCGDLVLELRRRVGLLERGRVFKLTARDPGAPEDLPAWCRLTGHTLVCAAPPDYWVQRGS